MTPMLRAQGFALALLLGVFPAAALADVVGPCPPLFDASHRGCHFEPSRTELFVLGGVALFALLVTVVLLAFSSARKKGPPEA